MEIKMNKNFKEFWNKTIIKYSGEIMTPEVLERISCDIKEFFMDAKQCGYIDKDLADSITEYIIDNLRITL